jgi:hypothetical protein
MNGMRFSRTQRRIVATDTPNLSATDSTDTRSEFEPMVNASFCRDEEVFTTNTNVSKRIWQLRLRSALRSR